MSCQACHDRRVNLGRDRKGWFITEAQSALPHPAENEEGPIAFCPFCGANLDAPPLAWTREKPTKPGVYWLREGTIPEILVTVDDDLWVEFFGTDRMMEVQKVGGPGPLWPGSDLVLWCGPLAIEKPAPPKDGT